MPRTDDCDHEYNNDEFGYKDRPANMFKIAKS